MMQNSALAQAESLLLAPFSLTEGDLSRTFGQILTHQVDYADLYFQYSRSEAWSLDEGIVKSGSFNIDQGVGVRALSGEKTAFAYSDDISAIALGDAFKLVACYIGTDAKVAPIAERKLDLLNFSFTHDLSFVNGLNEVLPA